jgi:protein O-GlcNAc transferase
MPAAPIISGMDERPNNPTPTSDATARQPPTAAPIQGTVQTQSAAGAQGTIQALGLGEELQRAAGFHQRGDLRAAAAAYRRILSIDPRDFAANQLLGAIELQNGRPDVAVTMLALAVEVNDTDPDAHSNLAAAYKALGRTRQALVHYQHALQLKPDFALALRNSAVLFQQLDQPTEALANWERALHIRPADPPLLVGCGNTLLALSRLAEAIAYYDRALGIDADNREALNNRGWAQLRLGNAAAALASFDRLLELSPRVAGFLNNRGEALRRLRRFGEAAEAYAAVLQIAPDFDWAAGKCLSSSLYLCDWSQYASNIEAVERRVLRGERACAPFEFLAVSGSARAQLQCARTYAAKLAAAAPGSTPIPRRPVNPGDKLRIAYVSADFGNRPLSHLMAGVWEQHDRAGFETIGLSLRPPGSSAIDQRVARSVDRFIDVSCNNDIDVLRLMARLDIHIAVDLMGHTQGSRPGLFLRRVAPVQVTYLGFPGTCGTPGMDYILADDFVIPPTTVAHYAEPVAYLPHCFQANDDQRPIGVTPTREAVGLPEDAFVFCCFNNSYKINPPMFDIWCRLLAARPGSVLWLIADVPAVEHNLRREARQRGVDPSCLVFAQRVPYSEHLGRQALADLFLDTLPFNAGTTASDALWAGLPILTCAGDSFAARMSGSLLRTLALPELITHRLEDYERRALELSLPASGLRALRGRLRESIHSAPLFHTAGFCRELEAIYRELWERYVREDQRSNKGPANSW